MNINIGGIILNLETTDQSLYIIMHDLCSVFSSSLPTEWRVRLVTASGGEVMNTSGIADNEGYTICLDTAGRSVCITIRQCSALMCANALKNLCAYLLKERGGIVLHAAGVLHRDKACLFLGPSGSGKTTVAALSAFDRKILSQEAIGVFEKDGVFFACALPYAADCLYPGRAGGSYEIAGLFYLVQDKRHSLVPKRPAAMLADMAHGGIPEAALLERACRLVETVPCYDLHFLQDGSFWRCIDEELGETVSCA